MAYTAPRTWVDSEVVTAALFDAHISANIATLRNGNDAYCKLYLDSNPTIANNVATIISWTNAAFNIGGIWSLDFPTRLIAPVTGKYRIYVNQEWRSNTANLRNISIVRSTGVQLDLQSQGAAGGKSNVSGQVDVLLTAGVYCEVRAFQSSGGNLSLHGGTTDRTRVSVILLGT